MLEYASNEEDYEDEIEINYASKVKSLPKEKVRDIYKPQHQFLDIEDYQ